MLVNAAPRAVRTFKAKINIVYAQHTTIKVGYTPYLHILMVRQSAVVEDIETVRSGAATATAAAASASAITTATTATGASADSETVSKETTSTDTDANTDTNIDINANANKVLRPGDMSIITFRFSHRCEFIRSGMRIMFRDGKVKGIGQVVEVLHEE